jgi:hypothetical protein
MSPSFVLLSGSCSCFEDELKYYLSPSVLCILSFGAKFLIRLVVAEINTEDARCSRSGRHFNAVADGGVCISTRVRPQMITKPRRDVWDRT